MIYEVPSDESGKNRKERKHIEKFSSCFCRLFTCCLSFRSCCFCFVVVHFNLFCFDLLFQFIDFSLAVFQLKIFKLRKLEIWKKKSVHNEKTQTFSIEKYIWNNSLTYFFPLLDTLDSLKWEKKLANDSLRWSIQESILGIRMNSCHMTEYNGRQ